MTFGSVCSGIEAASCAWLPLGWKCEFVAEVEPFPSAVLAHHYPDVPNLGDITKHEQWKHGPIDVLIGGTPCQSFSVAGLRAGLADPRGNLALVFLSIVARTRPRFVVWENVPGVHSSWSDAANRGQTEATGRTESDFRRLCSEAGLDRDTAEGFGGFEEVDQTNDFDCFIAGLEQLGYGVACAILDAQYFGLAQRRERVFVVGHIGGQWQRAAAVLFDFACLRGDPAPSREAGQRTSPTIAGCSNGGGANGPGRDVDSRESLVPVAANPIGGHHHRDDLDNDTYIPTVTTVDATNNVDRGDSQHAERRDVQRVGCPEVARAVTSERDGYNDGSDQTYICIAHGQANAEQVKDGEPSLTCNHEAPIVIPIQSVNMVREKKQNGIGIGKPDDEMFTLTGRDQHAIAFDTTQVTSPANYSVPKADAPCHPLAESAHPPAIAFSVKDSGADATSDLSPTLRSGNEIDGNANGGVMPAVAFPQNLSATQCAKAEEVAPAIQSKNPTAVAFQPRYFTRDNKTGNKESCGDQCAALSADHSGGDSAPHVAFQTSQSGVREVDAHATLDSNNGSRRHNGIAGNFGVRRLTPLECERLQGFPENWTLVPYNGKPASDSVRYRAIGNSMAVPVIRWIGDRIQMVDAIP